METPDGGVYALYYRVDGFARGEEIGLVKVGEDVDVFVSSNVEIWISKKGGLCVAMLIFLGALLQEPQLLWRVWVIGRSFSSYERRSFAMACAINVGFLGYRDWLALKLLC